MTEPTKPKPLELAFMGHDAPEPGNETEEGGGRSENIL